MTDMSEQLMQRVYAILRRFKHERYLPFIAPVGVTQSEATVITTIYMGQKEGLSPVQPQSIAKFLHQSPSAVSQVLKSLEEKGHLKREKMQGDYRAVSLELTESGLALAQEAVRIHETQFSDLLQFIGHDETEHLLSTLEKILDYQKEQAESGKIEKLNICEGDTCA